MTSENRAILFEKQGNICIITHNRPEAMNAHNYQATFEEAEAYKEFERDPDLRVAIVTGSRRQGLLRRRRPEGARHGLRELPEARPCAQPP